MKVSIYSFFLILLLTSFGCSDNCQDEQMLGAFELNKMIEIITTQNPLSESFTIVDGTETVFVFDHIGAQCDEVLDDEWGESLTFQIDSGLEDFSYSNGQLLNLSCFYRQEGAWVSSGNVRIDSGSIVGNKIDSDSWQIDIDVSYDGSGFGQSGTVDFSGVFEIK